MEDSSFLSVATCGHGEHFCLPSTSPQNWGHLSWWGRSKQPHSNLDRCRCVLFGTGSCMAILSAQHNPFWSFELVGQFDQWGWKSHVNTSWPTFKGTQIEYGWLKRNGNSWSCVLQLAWRYGNLPLQHPSQDQRPYILYTPYYHPAKHSAVVLLSPSIPLLIHAAAVPLCRISALSDAFRRFSPGLAYFALHLFRTEWNWSKYM